MCWVLTAARKWAWPTWAQRGRPALLGVTQLEVVNLVLWAMWGHVVRGRHPVWPCSGGRSGGIPEALTPGRSLSLRSPTEVGSEYTILKPTLERLHCVCSGSPDSPLQSQLGGRGGPVNKPGRCSTSLPGRAAPRGRLAGPVLETDRLLRSRSHCPPALGTPWGRGHSLLLRWDPARQGPGPPGHPLFPSLLYSVAGSPRLPAEGVAAGSPEALSCLLSARHTSPTQYQEAS